MSQAGLSRRAQKVPKPESYNALVAAAQGMVGRDKDIRFFHGAQQELRQEHVQGLKDGDVIYVKADGRQMMWKNPTQADSASVYRNDFVKHPVAQDYQAKKVVVRPGPLPFEGQSSYNAEYIAHEVLPRPKVGPHRGLISSSASPFEGSSQYKDDFVAVELTPSVPMVPLQRPREPQKFEGVSTYADSYIPRACEASPSQPPRQVASGPPKPRVPFTGSSHYKDEYKQLPQQSYAPQPAQRQRYQAPLPFEGASTYAQDYQRFQRPRPEHVHLVPIDTVRGPFGSPVGDAAAPPQVASSPSGSSLRPAASPAPASAAAALGNYRALPSRLQKNFSTPGER